MTAIREASLWFPKIRLDSQVKLRLFCFPYAGGGANIFRTWAAGLPSQIEVCPAELPGRGQRIRESGYTNLPELTKALAEGIRPFLNKPFAFFGHSMGAMIAFELARELRRTAKPPPVHLFASGRTAPQIQREKKPTHNLPEAEFIEEVRNIKGTPKEVLEHPELMEMVMPLLRADFQIVETYTYVPEAPLDCPITVLGGLQDLKVPRARLAAWREQTTAPFSLRIMNGDHFFVNTAQSLIYRILAHELSEYIR
jgi:medium-chain acyl-[acyl-carrier-protein] hydrolase